MDIAVFQGFFNTPGQYIFHPPPNERFFSGGAHCQPYQTHKTNTPVSLNRRDLLENMLEKIVPIGKNTLKFHYRRKNTSKPYRYWEIE